MENLKTLILHTSTPWEKIIRRFMVNMTLAGKRTPDIPFLKGVYKVLRIDADFLLEHA